MSHRENPVFKSRSCDKLPRVWGFLLDHESEPIDEHFSGHWRLKDESVRDKDGPAMREEAGELEARRIDAKLEHVEVFPHELGKFGDAVDVGKGGMYL